MGSTQSVLTRGIFYKFPEQTTTWLKSLWDL